MTDSVIPKSLPKRPSTADAPSDERRTRPRCSTSDDEVEEFFAIVRSMHELVKRRGKDVAVYDWRPEFLEEDFRGRIEPAPEKGRVPAGVWLDLNAEPEPEKAHG